ncbi:hypothetical protein TSMEX_004850 [Taenia solium]|eukprot:TsM_000469800 transcript=TsM_000469800 gene=TsM_000469800
MRGGDAELADGGWEFLIIGTEITARSTLSSARALSYLSPHICAQHSATTSPPWLEMQHTRYQFDCDYYTTKIPKRPIPMYTLSARVHHDFEVCRHPRRKAQIDANQSRENAEKVPKDGAATERWLNKLSRVWMDRRVIAAYLSRLVTLRENHDRALHAHPVPAQEVNAIQVPALGQTRVQESAETAEKNQKVPQNAIIGNAAQASKNGITPRRGATVNL